MAHVLDRPACKRLIRSSTAPFFTPKERIDDYGRTLKYFQEHGGYGNAHKAEFTVLKY